MAAGIGGGIGGLFIASWDKFPVNHGPPPPKQQDGHGISSDESPTGHTSPPEHVCNSSK